MSKSTQQPPEPQTALADEIRASESLFVEAATKAFHERISLEYYRMRGYAVESGLDQITLQFNAVFDFRPAKRSVCIESVPQFIPEPGRTILKVKAPAIPVDKGDR